MFHRGPTFQAQLSPIARLARRELAWRAIGTALVACVANAMPAAMGHHHLLAVVGEFTNGLAGFHILDHRAERHLDNAVIAPRAGAIGTATILAALGRKPPGEPEVGQRVDLLVTHGVDMATIATIPAVRPAEGHVFLTAESHTTVAAIAGFDGDGCLINKLHG